jgi:hypothetical protein
MMLGMSGERARVTRDSLPRLLALPAATPIPVPARVWTDAEWEQIRLGHRARDMDDRWHAFVEDRRLFLHRSWTGAGVYEAEFAAADGGWHITEALVAGDPSTYRRGADRYESMLLEYLIDAVLLQRHNDTLWQRLDEWA